MQSIAMDRLNDDPQARSYRHNTEIYAPLQAHPLPFDHLCYTFAFCYAQHLYTHTFDDAMEEYVLRFSSAAPLLHDFMAPDINRNIK